MISNIPPMHIVCIIIVFSESVAVGLLAVSIFGELGGPGFCDIAHGLFVRKRKKKELAPR